MSKPHFRVGWESGGKGDVTNGLILPRKLSLSHGPASPVLALLIWGVTPVGTGGLVSCALTQGPSASDVRNGFFTMQTPLFRLTLSHRFTDKSQPPHSG